MNETELRLVALGYTLGTGKLWAPFAAFHAFVEMVADRPVLTHELADQRRWDELRGRLEVRLKSLAEADIEAGA